MNIPDKVDPWEGFTGQSEADAADAELIDPVLKALGESRARTNLWAVPIETAPDWTFDPLTIAWLRLTATLIVALHLRQITNWLTRALNPNGETR